MTIGKHLKRIRKNKGYTQKYSAENILSQSSYSKFEDEKSDIKAETFINILNKFHISPSEFLFIADEYKVSEEQQILMDFFNLPYNDLHRLHSIKNKIMAYENSEKNIMLSDVLTICNALIKLAQTSDIDRAREIVEPVWDRLSTYNNWYLTDIKLINVLLYLFPVDTAIEVTKSLLNRLNQYKGYQYSVQLQSTLLINLTLLLIKDKNYQEALSVLEDTIKTHQKQMPYQSLALCFSRKSLCLHHLGHDSANNYLQKAKQLLEIYEENDMWILIEKEHQTYSI
ncbi:helix-turn-helix domain-containing protein [Sporosarcina siberiensis]|uniref:Helix-turn-helix domain-containing protein n=1 Tax=Sporosarcina siberiensis TaxID=1365606 RepID=A0ABW4SIY8_9BACL